VAAPVHHLKQPTHPGPLLPSERGTPPLAQGLREREAPGLMLRGLPG
jgi:hypothetical protein